MTTEPITKQRKGNITLTWNDKPLTPVKPKEAPKPEPTPAPAPEEEAAAPTPAPVAAPEVEPSETTQATPKKKSRVGAFIVDSLLVLALAGVIGGGAWYTYQQLETYRVPTPMELAQAEYLELCKQHEQLQDAAYKADEQLHLRERLNSLELQLAEVKRNIEEHKRTLDIERDRVLDDEYRKYQDRLGAYYKELGYWQDAADTAYNRYQNAEQQAYDRQQDAYDRLVDMIVTTGYVPDADDLAAAGMKDREYQAYLNYFNMMNAPTASSGGGGRRSSKKKKDEEESGSRYDEMLAEQKNLIDLGKSVEVINGALSNHAGSNGLSVEETRRIMEELTNYAVSKGKV